MRSLTLPHTKQVVELREWITGRQDEYISQPMTDIKLQISEAGKASGEVRAGEARTQSLHRAIETVVMSVGGATKGVLDLVLDLPKEDYALVCAEVDKVVSGKNFEEPVSKTDGGTD